MAEPSVDGLPAKLYFRIGEVAGLVGVEPHVLRYWEREFRAIRPSKSARGQRVYTRRDVENLIRVRELLYGQGFTIAGAKKRLQKGAPLAEPVDPESLGQAAPVEEIQVASEPPQRAPSGASKAREQLLAIREEIQAFLADLDPQRRG